LETRITTLKNEHELLLSKIDIRDETSVSENEYLYMIKKLEEQSALIFEKDSLLKKEREEVNKAERISSFYEDSVNNMQVSLSASRAHTHFLLESISSLTKNLNFLCNISSPNNVDSTIKIPQLLYYDDIYSSDSTLSLLEDAEQRLHYFNNIYLDDLANMTSTLENDVNKLLSGETNLAFIFVEPSKALKTNLKNYSSLLLNEHEDMINQIAEYLWKKIEKINQRSLMIEFLIRKSDTMKNFAQIVNEEEVRIVNEKQLQSKLYEILNTADLFKPLTGDQNSVIYFKLKPIQKNGSIGPMAIIFSIFKLNVSRLENFFYTETKRRYGCSIDMKIQYFLEKIEKNVLIPRETKVNFIMGLLNEKKHVAEQLSEMRSIITTAQKL